ncbi:hypothetical protein [Streptomyces sp. NBC_01544]|uniref:hypothetical protein n=1 Tax=unclassified Streptomyces TaxID=2593676 RepID=UPI00386B76F8
METSKLKTLASKHRSTVMKMARKYKATIDTPTALENALKSSSSAEVRRRRWLPASAASGSNGSAQRQWPTASR